MKDSQLIQSNNLRLSILICAVVALFALLFLLPERGRPQGGAARRRLVEKKSLSQVPFEPVEIINVKTRKRSIQLGKEFGDDDDKWAKGLTVTVRNISHKTATYIRVSISFERPESMTDEPPLVHSLEFGRRSRGSGDSAIVIAPDAKIDLSLADSSYDAIERALARLGYRQEHLKIYLSEVIFDDDTMWTAGYWFRRDSVNPEKWTPIEKQDNPIGRLRDPPSVLKNHALSSNYSLLVEYYLCNPRNVVILQQFIGKLARVPVMIFA